METSGIEETHIMVELDLDDGYATAAPVKSFPPNGYGLYDMSGNVAEWCLDAYQKIFTATAPQKTQSHNIWTSKASSGAFKPYIQNV